MKIKSRESMSYSEASNFFGLSKTTLLKWKKRLEPLNSRNKPSTKIDMEALAKDVELKPDSYQYERAKRLGVSTRTVGYALKRLGVTYKKKPEAPKSERRREAYLPRKNKKL